MLTSLRSRNVAVMAGVLLVTQVLTTVLVAALVISPQADRVARIIAGNVQMVGVTLDTLGAEQRRDYVNRVNRSGSFRIVPVGAAVPGEDGTPTLLEQRTLVRLAELLGQRQTMVWRGGGGAPLWVRMRIGTGGTYWVTVAPNTGWSPSGALIGSVALTLALSLMGGLAVQRRINRPLTALREAVDAMPDARPFRLLANRSPVEIAAVADSFTRMANRLAEQEAERTLMLTGISHDLKTPLAKLRLAFAVARSGQPDLDALINRQLNQLEAMLDQFLDFGRGLEAELPVARPLIRAISSAAASHGLDDNLTVAADVADAAVMLRPLAFDRAMANIFRNAQIHGQPPVTIRISRAGGYAVIDIEDSGPGVPDSMIDRLDRPFVRVDQHRPSDGGVGLGLAIVRRFADLHEARLSFANRENGGFRVTLQLPIVTGHQPDPA